MTHDATQLTDLIGSRICHDLISPLGAISNGLELLGMSIDTATPEMSLIQESVENANARIRYFRIAYGSATAEQSVGEAEITAILRDVARGLGRVVIDWQPRGAQGRGEVKLAFLLLQCFEAAMPWGGHITVSEIAGEWAIHGTADRLQIEPELWAMLSGPGGAHGLAASKVQFAMAPLAAEAVGRRLGLETSETSLRVRF